MLIPGNEVHHYKIKKARFQMGHKLLINVFFFIPCNFIRR